MKTFLENRQDVTTTNFTTDAAKSLSRLSHQFRLRLPQQKVHDCIVVFLDIRTASLAKTIIDEELYDAALDNFVDEVDWIIHKMSPGTVSSDITNDYTTNDDDNILVEESNVSFGKDYVYSEDIIEDTQESDNQCTPRQCCLEWINLKVNWKEYLNDDALHMDAISLDQRLKYVSGRFTLVDPLK